MLRVNYKEYLQIGSPKEEDKLRPAGKVLKLLLVVQGEVPALLYLHTVPNLDHYRRSQVGFHIVPSSFSVSSYKSATENVSQGS